MIVNQTVTKTEDAVYKKQLLVQKSSSLSFDLVGARRVPNDHGSFGELVQLLEIGLGNLD